MTLQALGTKLVLKKIEKEQTSASGIVLSNSQDPNPRAYVLSIGQDAKKKLPTLRASDLVCVEWSQTAPVKDQGSTFYIADWNSIYAVEKEES